MKVSLLSPLQISPKMGSSSCSCLALFRLEVGRSFEWFKRSFSIRPVLRRALVCSRQLSEAGVHRRASWSFAGGWTDVDAPWSLKPVARPKGFRVNSLWLASSRLASRVFTLGTVAVLPFYALMVAAPKAEMTRKCIQSSIPFIALGLLYAYLLYLSWTPDTLRLIFASKYWLPELPGIARMFSNEMTLASAWIHLLAIDLFSARQIFHDGLKNEIETRHSVLLCLLFCPVGIMAHFVTKALTEIRARSC